MNRLFLVAITGECSLFYLHGIKFRYNPFMLLQRELAKVGVKINVRNRAETFAYLNQLFADNGMTQHKLMPMVLAKLENQKKK